MYKETRVRVECVGCGVVQVMLPALTLRCCVDNDRWSYCFRCPECGLAASHDAHESAVAVLIATGAPTERWHLPAELGESRISAPVLTLDDLLDFHLMLEDADWFESLFSRPEADAR